MDRYKAVVPFGLYLCVEFSRGTKFKKELHNVTVTLLGGEEQGGRACLRKQESNTHTLHIIQYVSYSIIQCPVLMHCLVTFLPLSGS